MPSLLVSFFTLAFCILSIILLSRRYQCLGLSSFLVICPIMANIQILYATTYEIVNLNVLLGTVVFGASFLANDLINQNYGSAAAKKAVMLSFIVQVIFMICMIFTLGHKPLDYSVNSDFSISKETMDSNIASLQNVFVPQVRFFIGSCIAFLISQLSEINLFNMMKKASFLKYDYIRQNISLFISSILIDTLVFTAIALVLLTNEPLSFKDFLEICSSTILIRATCNLLNTAVLKAFNSGRIAT